MRPLTTTDLNLVTRRLPKDLRELMKGQVLFVAGGFIRECISGGAVQDIDVFGVSQDQLQAAAESLAFNRGAAARLHATQYAYSVFCPPRAPVQFIHKWCYCNPDQLLEELDFTVCQACIWWANGEWQSLCADDFYSDLAARRLVYTFPKRIEAAGGSLMRVRKFLARGWNIQVHSLAGVVARLIGGIKEERLGGLLGEGKTLEQARHTVLKALLHEVDPLLVVDAVEPRDEVEE